MKRMNNKGFAITALIYGLAIMAFLLIVIIMSTLSSMRKNVKELSQEVESELLNLSKISVEYADRGTANNPKEYIYNIYSSGYYRIETWSPVVIKGGKGYRVYSTGVINLNKTDPIDSLLIQFYDKSTKVYRNNNAPKENNESCVTPSLMCTNSDGDSYSSNTLGGLNHESRSYLFSIQNRAPYYYYSIWPDYRFYDTFNIKEEIVGSKKDIESGKVVIQKISDKEYNGNDRLKYKDINIKLIGNLATFFGSPSYTVANHTCSVYYGSDPYDNQNGNKVYCEKLIGETAEDETYYPPNIFYSIPGYNNSVCYNRKYDSKTDFVTNGDKNEYNYKLRGFPSSIPSTYTYNYIGLTIACPKIYQTYNIGIKVEIKGVDGTTETIYNGKYMDNNKSSIQLSPYQPNLMVDKPKSGNFYILTYEGLTAVTVNPVSNEISLKSLYGLPSQKWHIETIGNYNLNSKEVTNAEYDLSNSIDRIYKIESLSNFRAVDILEDENKEGNRLSTQYTFNPLSLNSPQAWRMIKNEDGTYSFKTIINNEDDKIGYIGYEKNPGSNIYEFKIVKLNNDGTIPKNAKFILYTYDNSLDKN